MIRAILRATLISAVCLGTVAAVAYRLDVLYGFYGGADRERMATGGIPEDERLFGELLSAGLLIPRPDGGLDRTPEDHLLLERLKSTDGASDTTRERRRLEAHLLEQLDASAVGAIVRREVELWNQTRRVVAIRDDRPAPDGRQPPDADEATRWSALNARGRLLAPGTIVPETFGFVHEGRLRPGFGDWLSVNDVRGPVRFRTMVDPGDARTLVVQVIGTVIEKPPDARLRQLAIEAQGACAEKPAAAVLDVPVRASANAAILDIVAVPSMTCTPRIHGLAISMTTMATDGEAGAAGYAWRPVARARHATGRFVIRTADGIALTAESGTGAPTAATYELGLLPIVGASTADAARLSGMLSRTPLPPGALEVALTVDGAVQRAAQEAVTWGIKRFGNDPWIDERKAAVVVLDADTGAILAVAGSPTVPVGVNSWDYASFSATYPLRDPSTVIAWEVIDKHNTPGSTFKPVTALALMLNDGEEFRQRIRPIIMGLDGAGLARDTGLTYAATAFVAYRNAKPIPNFDGANLGRYVDRPQRDPSCVEHDPVGIAGGGTLGLLQAVQFSLNAWFARVALMMEQPRIDAYATRVKQQAGARIPVPEMALTHTARRLGIDDRERLDLAVNVPPAAALARIAGASFDVLYTQLARSTLAQMAYNKDDWGARELIMYTAALNGIGQTVSTSPLHMALAAAAIAAAHRVRPHLVSGWGGEPLAPPPTDPLPVDPELLRYLRDGMKAVAEAGTAARALPRPLACRVYGKTGTAEIDAARKYNSAWFIGWREPRRPDERRLAFACMITHATSGFRFGGTACAPVVSRILQALEAEARPGGDPPRGGPAPA